MDKVVKLVNSNNICYLSFIDNILTGIYIIQNTMVRGGGGGNGQPGKKIKLGVRE